MVRLLQVKKGLVLTKLLQTFLGSSAGFLTKTELHFVHCFLLRSNREVRFFFSWKHHYFETSVSVLFRSVIISDQSAAI